MKCNKHISYVIYEEAKPGNKICGDASYVAETEQYVLIALIDGLGSGEMAHEAAEKLKLCIKKNHQDVTLQNLIEMCNEEMLHQRGAVLCVVKLYPKDQKIIYCNIGNINGYIVHSAKKKVKHFRKQQGYLPGVFQAYNENCISYEKGDYLFLHTDGIEEVFEGQLLNTQFIGQLYRQIVEGITLKKDDRSYVIGYIG